MFRWGTCSRGRHDKKKKKNVQISQGVGKIVYRAEYCGAMRRSEGRSEIGPTSEIMLQRGMTKETDVNGTNVERTSSERYTEVKCKTSHLAYVERGYR